MGSFTRVKGGGSGKREIWERRRKQSRGRDRENMILLQYVDEWASSSWSFGGFLLRERGGKRGISGVL